MYLLHELSLMFLVLCVALANEQNGRPGHDSRGHRSSAPNGNDFQGLVEAFEGNTEAYLRYTPTTPAPHNINCYVDVPSTIRKGGRCVQMPTGRYQHYSYWACQAGIHLAFSNDCPQVRVSPRRGRRG